MHPVFQKGLAGGVDVIQGVGQDKLGSDKGRLLKRDLQILIGIGGTGKPLLQRETEHLRFGIVIFSFVFPGSDAEQSADAFLHIGPLQNGNQIGRFLNGYHLMVGMVLLLVIRGKGNDKIVYLPVAEGGRFL